MQNPTIEGERYLHSSFQTTLTSVIEKQLSLTPIYVWKKADCTGSALNEIMSLPNDFEIGWKIVRTRQKSDLILKNLCIIYQISSHLCFRPVIETNVEPCPFKAIVKKRVPKVLSSDIPDLKNVSKLFMK